MTLTASSFFSEKGNRFFVHNFLSSKDFPRKQKNTFFVLNLFDPPIKKEPVRKFH